MRVWAEGLRHRLHAEGVKVSCVTPGYIRGPMTAAFGGSLNLVGMVSQDYAAARVADGLAVDEPLIAFPHSTFIASWMLSTLPPAVRDAIAASRLFAELRYANAGAPRPPAPPAAHLLAT